MDDWEEKELTVTPCFDLILGGSAKTLGRCPAPVRLENFNASDPSGTYDIFDLLSGQVSDSQLATLPAFSTSSALNRFIYLLQIAAASQFGGRAQDAESAEMLSVWQSLPTPVELQQPEWSEFFDSAQPIGASNAAQLPIQERHADEDEESHRPACADALHSHSAGTAVRDRV